MNVWKVGVAILFFGATAFVGWTATRRPPTAAESEPFDPQDAVTKYGTAWLSTVALDLRSATLVQGLPLPRLSALTRDPGLLAWESQLPSSYDKKLTSDVVIGFLVALAQWPTPNDPKIDTELHAKLIVGGALRDVAFGLVLVTLDSGQRQLTVHIKGD